MPDTPAYGARVLPPAEWPRLAGTEAEQLWPLLTAHPERAEVLVIERDGAIVGCWTLLQTLHAECLWIAPSQRGRGGVARSLFRFLCERVRAAGYDVVATAATSDPVRRLLEHVHAYRLPGDHYVFRVKESVPCRLE